MIAHSILAAKNSGLFDSIFVSTEDDEIADVSKTFGSEIIQRPLELADDYTETIPVVRHSIEWILDKGIKVDAVCCIYGCAPLVLASFLPSRIPLAALLSSERPPLARAGCTQ